MGGGGNPPVVTLVEPEDFDVGDPVGVERMFTAECDQPATMKVYLDGNLVHTSDLDIQEVFYTFKSAPLGQHMVRVVAANANGTGENYWTWSVVWAPQSALEELLSVTRQYPGDPDPDHTIDAYYSVVIEYLGKCELYDGDWLYDFRSGATGMMRDYTNNPYPGIRVMGITVQETDNIANHELYTSLDPNCVGAWPEDGIHESNYGAYLALLSCSLAAFPPYVGFALSAGQLALALTRPPKNGYDIQKIKYKWNFSPDQTDVSHVLRWSVRVRPGERIGFEITSWMVGIPEFGLECTKKIMISASEDPEYE